MPFYLCKYKYIHLNEIHASYIKFFNQRTVILLQYVFFLLWFFYQIVVRFLHNLIEIFYQNASINLLLKLLFTNLRGRNCLTFSPVTFLHIL